MPQSNNNYFKELDLEELKRTANLWVKDENIGGPCIQRISLYRPAGKGKSNGFVFAVETSINNETIFNAYHNWAWGSCLHIQDILPSFYTELNSPVLDKWIWITFRDDVATLVNIARFENHCDPDCKVVLYPNPVDDLCKEAIKKGYTNIINLSFILAEDEQYTDKSLSCLWEKLKMRLRDRKEPDLSSTEKKVGTWFKILQRVISGKIAEISHPLTIKRLTNYDENQISGELQKPIYGGIGDFIKLSDLKAYFRDQIEMEPPSKLFPSQKSLLPKEITNSGYNQQGGTEDDKLYYFISWVKYEVELFYSKLKDELRASRKNVGDATQSKALDVFDKNQNSFDKIEKEDIQDDFYGGEHPTRAKGLIANKIMKRVDPELFLNLKGKANAQKLDKLLKKQPMK